MSSERPSTLVVINDDPAVGRKTADALAGLGYCVRTYVDATSALDGLERGDSIALIVSDLCMPAIDGWRFTRLLRSLEAIRTKREPVPVLIVSSTFSGPDAEQVSRMAGGNAFLANYDPALLRLRARDLLDGREASLATRVLILDPDPARAGDLRAAFEENGHAVVVATATDEVDLSAELTPDIVLIEFDVLARADAGSLRRIRRADSLAIPLIATNRPPDASLSAMLSLGADESVSAGVSARRCVRICEEVHRERSLMRVVKSLEERTRSLQESEARYRSVFENAHDMIQSIASDGQFLFVNPAWLRTIGYGWDELQQMSFLDVVHPESHAHCRSMLQAVRDGSDVDDLKLVLVSKDGRKIEVEANFSGEIKGGKVSGIHGMLRDVSERRHLELQLFQAQKLESIGTLAGGIAHDFNNILTAVLGYSELASEAVPAQSEARRLIDEVTRQGQRAADLVMRLLTFARQSAPERRPTSLATLTAETLGVLTRTLPRNISIKGEIPATGGVINADPTQITQVVMNLCVNAAQAMPQGGVLEVTLKTVTVDHRAPEISRDIVAGRYVRLAVRDSGVGMSPDVMKRIFEPFFTTKPESEGTGLGLSVVYGIVRSHDGYIGVNSRLGEGSVFEVYFPALAALDSSVAPSKESAATGSETILVVDDEPAVLEIGRRILEGLGYRVFTAKDGKEAIDMYGRLSASDVMIDMVFTDIVMPRMDGLELHRKLQEVDPDVRVLFASGNITETDLQSQNPQRIRGFIRKPYGQAQLSKAIRAVLDARGATHAHPAARADHHRVGEETRI